MDLQADARPFAVGMRADRGEAFVLTDKCECITQRLFGCGLERVALRIEARLQTVQKPREIAFAVRRGF